MNDNPNKIQRLQLENFTCFERADLEFSPGMNVFIGENGTGKTHLLKVMYATTRDEPNSIYVREYFGITNTKELVRQPSDAAIVNIVKAVNQLEAILDYDAGTFKINRFENRISSQSGLFLSIKNALYIPPPEMLSWQFGFVNIFLKQENGFDRTYFDLAVALNGKILKNPFLEEAEILAKEVRKAIKAEVSQKDERFYFKFDDLDTELEAPVVAQGINKLGQLYYLILNGSLTKDTILFWDEPETGLNPKYIKIVAQFLQTLANAGVQIFVATHDYLLVHQLSLAAEYREVTQAPEMKFFSLYKGENGTEIESGETVTALQHNTILDEYAALHNEQLRLYSELLQKV